MERHLDTSAGRIRVLAYRMEDRRALPLFINIHGGGFVFANADMDDPFMPGLAREADAKIISIDYSLAPEHPFPMAVEECYAVAQYAREHAAQMGIDPARIAMGGHSAGDNFATEKLDAFPPVLMITASRDFLCAEGKRFRDRLIQAGVEVAHRRFEAGHGFNLRKGAASVVVCQRADRA